MPEATPNITADIYKIIDEFPVLIAGINKQKKVVVWNRLCQQTFGYNFQFMSTAQDPLNILLPSLPEEQKSVGFIIDGKDENQLHLENVEVKDIKDENLYLDWYIRYRSHPLINDNITWFIGIDVTKQKKVSEDLRKSERRFKTISKATNDAVWDWDLTNNYLWWSKGMNQIFGYNSSEIENNIAWWIDNIHPDDRERVEKRIFDFIERKEQYWFDEYLFRRSDGSYARVFDKGFLIMNEENIPVQMIGGIMDITDKEIFKQNLFIKNAQLKEYAFYNSHKFRGPLSRVISLVHLLEIDEHTSDNNREVIRQIRTGIEELDKMVKDLAELLQ